MNDGTRKRLHFLLWAAVILGAAFCALITVLSPSSGASGTLEDTRWNEGWCTRAGETLTLPYASSSEAKTLTIEKQLPDTLPKNALLVLSDNYLPVRAQLDGVLVPVTGVVDGGVFGLTYAVPRVSIALAEDAAGKTLSLTFQNAGSKRRMEVYDAQLGAASAVMAQFNASDAWLNLFGGLLFLAGAGVLLLALPVKRSGLGEHRAELMYVAEFILLSAVWFLADSGDYALRMGRYSAYLFVNLFSYILLAVPFMLYISGHCDVGAKLIRRLSLLPMVMVAAVILSALLGAFNLSLILTISHAVYAVMIVCVLLCVGMTLLARKDRPHAVIFAGVCLLALSALATMISFYTLRSPDNTSWFRFGIAVFSALLIGRTVALALGGAVKARSVESLKRSATHDELTELYNKRAFCLETEKLLQKHPAQEFLLCCFDIDRFHLINDMFGHDTGNALLRHVAKILVENMPYMASFGRLDTDRFAFCLPAAPRRAALYADMLRTKIAAFPLRHVIVPSFGYYTVRGDRGEPVEMMIDRALLARETVKGSFISRFAFYDAALHEQQLFEQRIVNRIARAMEEGQIFMVLQPKYALDTRRMDGAEALVRWRDPEQGMISPGRFIPVLEKNGLILKLDEFIWERACMALRRWIDAFGEENTPPVSVNVSRVHLYHAELADTLVRLVIKYGIPPRLFALEITESAFSERPEALARLTDELHSRGFPVHMDDFGSAYSSLNMLRDVDVDVLKLDMRFLFGESNKERGAAIIKAVIAMAHALNVNVVAEGVENAAQADKLASIGCRSAQGFFFSAPLLEKEMTSLIALERHERARLSK